MAALQQAAAGLGRDELLLMRRISTVQEKRLQGADERELIPTGLL